MAQYRSVFSPIRQSDDRRPRAWAMAKQLLLFLGALAFLVGLTYFVVRGGNFARGVPSRSQLVDYKHTSAELLELCGLPPSSGHPTVIEMIYSLGKAGWIEQAAERFSRLCPSIQVALVPMADLGATSAILTGELRPTIWSPANELSISHLEYRSGQRATKPPYRVIERTELASSPLVLLIWEDRLRVLAAILKKDPSAEGIWTRTLCPLIPRNPDMTGVTLEAMVPGNWLDFYTAMLPKPARRKLPEALLPSLSDEPLPSLAELKSWGQVKIGRARPSRYSSGIATLYLMAYEYVMPPQVHKEIRRSELVEEAPVGSVPQSDSAQLAQQFERGLADQKKALRTWLRRCEGGLEMAPMSEPALTDAIFALGPAHLDAVVTYEHLTLPLLAKVDSYADSLRKLAIVYPEPTIMARNPAIIFASEPEKEDAARRWLKFLRSKELQKQAIEFGFRPVNHEVTIRGHDVEQNQFLRLRRYGVSLDLHLIEPPRPSGRAIEELVELWEDANGRN